MSTTLTAASANLVVNNFVTTVLSAGSTDPSPDVQILEGVTLLGTMVLNEPAFGGAVGGVATIDVTGPPTAAITVTGTPDTAIYRNRDNTEVMRSDVGGPASGAGMEVTPATLTAGQDLVLQANGTLTLPLISP